MKRLHWAVVVVLLSLGLAACGSSSDDDGGGGSGTTARAEDLSGRCTGEKVKFQLSFFPNAQFAGWLVADRQGFFAEEGLDVELVPGGPQTQVELALADGSVDVGLIDFTAGATARQRGAPITYVAQVYHRNSVAYVSLKRSGIERPEDLEGRKLGVQRVSASIDGLNPLVVLLLQRAGLGTDAVEKVPVGFGIEDLLAGKADVIPARVFFHIAQLESAGYDYPDGVNVLNPDDFGIDLVDHGVAVNDDYLADNRQAVACLLRAGKKGWEAAVADPDAAVRDVMAFLPKGSSNARDQAIDVAETLKLIKRDGMSDAELMRLDMDAIDATVDTMKRFRLFDEEFDTGDYVDTTLWGVLGES
ncbi:ABC transporter substrate-binding protein [Conexibacter arvalis]|uniref:Thiamine pyrimidine synthase n=1 Tax=Conexibacter arvalis TaxID=912552 RepID=A0A840IK31_9ACTN|nr:ABC transporter substrate-binding protein [Conexibacter arvalis]MBB4664288.1 NitT/TauT family transport system substrate-binding protein [Conexibacter arvalis]